MFFIFELQTRPDGVVNVVAPVARTSFAGACSYYYERLSKMVVNDQFTSVSVMLTDANLEVKLHETLISE